MPVQKAKIEIGQTLSPEGKRTRVLVGRLHGTDGASEIIINQTGRTIVGIARTHNGDDDLESHGYQDPVGITPDRQTLIQRLRSVISLSERVRVPKRTGIEGLNLRNKSDQLMLELLQVADKRINARHQLVH